MVASKSYHKQNGRSFLAGARNFRSIERNEYQSQSTVDHDSVRLMSLVLGRIRPTADASVAARDWAAEPSAVLAAAARDWAAEPSGVTAAAATEAGTAGECTHSPAPRLRPGKLSGMECASDSPVVLRALAKGLARFGARVHLRPRLPISDLRNYIIDRDSGSRQRRKCRKSRSLGVGVRRTCGVSIDRWLLH